VNTHTARLGTGALRNVRVKKPKTARPRSRSTEPAGSCPAANVDIGNVRPNGTTAKTLRLAAAPVNADRSVRFASKLKKGRYRWTPHATYRAARPAAAPFVSPRGRNR